MTAIDQLDKITDQITRAADAARSKRLIVAIVGAPGAGKSTLSAVLCANLGTRAITVPQDGFHLDNEQLIRSGQLASKGAPATFDAEGLTHLLARLLDAQHPVYFPIFDRAQDLSRAAAGVVGAEHRIILVEGNYLLLDHSGWAQMKQHFDLAIALDVDQKTLEQRLTKRWRDLGLSEPEIGQKVSQNDLPNGHIVRQSFGHADIIVHNLSLPPSIASPG